MRNSISHSHHTAVVAAVGALAGVIGLAVFETIPASAAGELAGVPNQATTVVESQAYPASEPLAELSEPTAAETPTLVTITPKSDPAAIEALESRLLWAGDSAEAPDGVWTKNTTRAVAHFQSKNKLSVNGVASVDTVQALVAVAGTGAIDQSCARPGIRICVDKSEKVARYFKNGHAIKTFDVNIGPEADDPKYGQYSSTRTGSFTVGGKDRDAVSSMYGYSMPMWMQFDNGIGFHYSEYFDQAGYADTSMGCVTIADRSVAEWLFDNTPIGTQVIVTD